MVLLTVSVDPTIVTASEVQQLLEGAQILHAAGIINTRWVEFSAWELAQEMGLVSVEWDPVADDTPGILEFIALYTNTDSPAVRERILCLRGIEDYELHSPD